ncbi:C2H2 type zinc finger domain-containing protein, partial [Diplocarpon rosae]
MPTVLRPLTHHIYDPDDVGLRAAPDLKPMKLSLVPSLNPEPDVSFPSVRVDLSSDPEDCKGPTHSTRRPSRGDAVLIAHMAGGNYSDVARDAGDKPLVSEVERAKVPGTDVAGSRAEGAEDQGIIGRTKVVAQVNGVDLATMVAMQTLAANALRQAAKGSPDPAHEAAESLRPRIEAGSEPKAGLQSTTVPPKEISVVDGPPSHQPQDRNHDMGAPSPVGGLPPIRHRSPQSSLGNGSGSSQITLPSISELGNFEQRADGAMGDPSYPQSPPGRPQQRFGVVPSQNSPPISPNDVFRGLPSPGRNQLYPPYTSGHRRPSQSKGESPRYQIPAEWSGSSSTEISTDAAGITPASIPIDRMSIDGITNPQIGGYQCIFPGCTAQPFQTQNEMIRHGLVHDSPGYVCPFCPDREHKYPRPDNLQRHVRVHHGDRDKDDALLRDVLSQRSEGPSRGRRRRGGTS